MPLRNNFYYIDSITLDEQKMEAFICFNPAHAIFDGHFPNQPVVPGVCMVQIVKELLQDNLQLSLHLQESNQMKFLQLMVPQEGEVVNVGINYTSTANRIAVNVTFSNSTSVTFKMMGVFIIK